MFESYRARYQKKLLESVTPFWLRHSIDREYGGYFTCLDRCGEVYDTRKYVWLQDRAVWTFSKLYNDVERRQEWLDAAAQGVNLPAATRLRRQGQALFQSDAGRASGLISEKTVWRSVHRGWIY